MFKKGYYYLHANSQIIWTSKEFNFNQSFVIAHWKVENYSDFELMKTQAKQIDNGI